MGIASPVAPGAQAPVGAAPRCRPARPVSRGLRTASTAPATSGPGAASPPMASMAITAATTRRFQHWFSLALFWRPTCLGLDHDAAFFGRTVPAWDSQTRWGMRAAAQFGHGLAAGTSVFIHCARRESRRALDCLLLERPYRRSPGRVTVSGSSALRAVRWKAGRAAACGHLRSVPHCGLQTQAVVFTQDSRG